MSNMLHNESRLLHAVLRGGEARVLLCDVTQMTREAAEIHGASRVCAVAMGRMIAAAAMMGCQLKDARESVTVTLRGDGPAGPLVAVARRGAVKVTIAHPDVEAPLLADGRLDVGGALGREGRLGVVRDLGFGEPYVGQVPLVSGEVGEDIAMYYTASEQTPTLCALGVQLGQGVSAAGGILLQAMPGCGESTLDALELRSQLFTGLSGLLQEYTLEQMLAVCFDGLAPTVLEEAPLRLACDCTRERVERALLSLGARELQGMIDDGCGAGVDCHFCRKRYAFTEAELAALRGQAKDGA
ncbi:MAG: Hsp33 family molecular chaperone HslO [Clostridia bacterium]|nr:Hsp33 family molecular chaperone HslO [Clostridia bacterium]